MDFSGGGRLGGIVYSYVNDVLIAPPTYRQQPSRPCGSIDAGDCENPDSGDEGQL